MLYILHRFCLCRENKSVELGFLSEADFLQNMHKAIIYHTGKNIKGENQKGVSDILQYTFASRKSLSRAFI